MKLTAIRRAMEELKRYADWSGVDEDARMAESAEREATEAEAFLDKAAALRSYAVAGLSAFHARLCLVAGRGADVPDDATKCQDPTCRAWVAALLAKEATDPEAARTAALEDLLAEERALLRQANAMLDAIAAEFGRMKRGG